MICHFRKDTGHSLVTPLPITSKEGASRTDLGTIGDRWTHTEIARVWQRNLLMRGVTGWSENHHVEQWSQTNPKGSSVLQHLNGKFEKTDVAPCDLIVCKGYS